MTTAAWEDIQDRKYPGYGRCIYCGSSGADGGLTDEHVLPYALGGKTIIEDASCKRCQRLIDPVDRHLGRAVFGNFRIHANVQTRRPSERPDKLPAQFTVGDKEVALDLPIADHPYSLAMPIWGDAGFFRGVSVDSPFPERYAHLYHYAPDNLRETLGVAESEDFKVWSQGNFNAHLFARSIAKIAYCHTVITYGLDGFRPLVLPAIILGQFTGVPYFVGAPLMIPPPPNPKGQRHLIQHAHLDGYRVHDKISGMGLKLHLVYVRLFADSAHKEHGMPIYHVIAGARGAPRIKSARFGVDTPRVITLSDRSS